MELEHMTKQIRMDSGLMKAAVWSGIALIVAMMCLPFGFLLSLLGCAKWLRNLRLRAK